MSLVAGELQRGSLPHSVYGELPFQLSGYAINTLRQGVDTIVGKYLRALEKAYQMIFSIIADQYSSGAYKSMEVAGMDRNRVYFSEEITSDVIEGTGAVEVHLVGQLPQDEMTRYSMAQIAREGPTPLLSDRAIRDRILAIQDADQMDDSIKEQMAERMLPEAALWTLLRASERQGRDDLVQFYVNELMSLIMQKRQMAEMRNAAMAGPPPGGPPGPGAPMPSEPPPGGPPTANPAVMPNAMMAFHHHNLLHRLGPSCLRAHPGRAHREVHRCLTDHLASITTSRALQPMSGWDTRVVSPTVCLRTKAPTSMLR